MWALGWRKAMVTAQLIGRCDCSPHLTYTSDGFFNNPHEDNQDISNFDFTLFFLTTKFGIDFTKQKGVVKLFWALKMENTAPFLPSKIIFTLV
ncbi:hypothetical protein H4Q26_012643 [Puccinia striiformis f. sp. tritici PST-130]|nr:hypothetical protein H4Q26_012643 [Puccinia striiformis f. sp. tritici PST-130]